MDIDEIADSYEMPNENNDWAEIKAVSRKSDIATAIGNIKKEQKVQKTTYDRKVKRNQYVDEIIVQIVIVILKCISSRQNRFGYRCYCFCNITSYET